MSNVYLKYARDLGARLALEDFRKRAEEEFGSFNKEAISPARARAAAEVALKRGMPDRAKRLATKAQDISIARKAEMDYGATREEARAMMPKRFIKGADAALGDPNYWTGGSQAQQAPPQPASAEEAIQLLPGGTFQGLQMKITPDGQRSTTVKVTPEATQDPTGLNSIFAAEPGAKVEVSNPEEAVPGTQVAAPGGPESGEMPPEGAMPPKLGVARIKAAAVGAPPQDPENNNLAWRLQQVLKNIGPAQGTTRPY